MQLKKAIISVLLLFVYSLGFAHTFIPHCHGEVTENVSHTEGEHHHHNHSQNHKHEKHEHSTHEHVNHGDHFDENLYDYFVCVLFEMEHQGHDTEFVHYLPQVLRANKIAYENDFSSHLGNLNQTFSLRTSPVSQPNKSPLISRAYFSPLINYNPLRGPPIV